MAQPTGSLARITRPATGAEESDDEDLSFFLTSPHIPVAQSLKEDNVALVETSQGDSVSIRKSLLESAAQDGIPAVASQTAGTAPKDFLASSFGYSSQLPPLFVPPYYLPLAQQIQQLQQQNQLQQHIIRQQHQQAQQHLRQLQDLQLAQQQQQIAQLQHEQLQRERERQDPLQPLKEGDPLRQPLQRLHSLTSSSPVVAGSQPTSTLHQVHSVGPAAVGSQLPPVSSQLWNFSLMGADPYLGTFNPDPATSLAALQTYYQTQLAAARLQLAEKAAGLGIASLRSAGMSCFRSAMVGIGFESPPICD